jgi:hypothetical protein
MHGWCPRVRRQCPRELPTSTGAMRPLDQPVCESSVGHPRDRLRVGRPQPPGLGHHRAHQLGWGHVEGELSVSDPGGAASPTTHVGV